MKVDGELISEQQVQQALLQLPKSQFKSCDLERLLIGQGVSEKAAYRGANRVLQRLRKAKQIHFKHGYWQALISARTMA